MPQIHSITKNQDLEGQDFLTINNSNNTSQNSPISLNKSGQHILAYPEPVLGMDYKKSGVCEKKTLGYKERCPDQRAAYCTQLAEIKQCGKTLVYVDESGFQAERIRRYAYAPKGKRVFDLISSQRFRKTTLVAARIADKFTAATLFEGSCNAERFNQWLEQELCPRLCWDHVVIMDNAR